MSLSAKFATLSGPAKSAGGKKKVGSIVLQKVSTPKMKGIQPVGKQGKKINQAIATQKEKRQTQVQIKRGIPSPVATQGKSGKGKNSKGKGPKGKGPKGKGKKEEEKKPVTAEDLDREIDMWWHKGGKGPNPVVVQLDKEMDDYMKSKTEE